MTKITAKMIHYKAPKGYQSILLRSISNTKASFKKMRTIDAYGEAYTEGEHEHISYLLSANFILVTKPCINKLMNGNSLK